MSASNCLNMVSKEPLFSVTRDDCDWQTFRSGGPGGQNQNKVETGVRCIHRASGASAESRTHNSQHANKQAAFRRMAESARFKLWLKIETGRRLGHKSIDTVVNEMMAAGNLKIEVRTEEGWMPE